MPESLLSMTKDLVLAQIQTGHLQPEEMTARIRDTYNRLKRLRHTELGQPDVPTPLSIVDWKSSIGKYSVTWP